MTTKITKDMLRVRIRNLIDAYINESINEGAEFPLSYRSAQGYCFFKLSCMLDFQHLQIKDIGDAWLDVWLVYKETEAYKEEFRKGRIIKC